MYQNRLKYHPLRRSTVSSDGECNTSEKHRRV